MSATHSSWIARSSSYLVRSSRTARLNPYVDSSWSVEGVALQCLTNKANTLTARISGLLNCDGADLIWDAAITRDLGEKRVCDKPWKAYAEVTIWPACILPKTPNFSPSTTLSKRKMVQLIFLRDTCTVRLFSYDTSIGSDHFIDDQSCGVTGQAGLLAKLFARLCVACSKQLSADEILQST